MSKQIMLEVFKEEFKLKPIIYQLFYSSHQKPNMYGNGKTMTVGNFLV